MARVTIPNPTSGGLVSANLITDRAKRYRAQAAVEQQEGRCIYCGRPGGRLDVEHINGKEADTNPANLAYSCRPCNVRKGNTFKRAGRGILTRQYNARGAGASSLAQWMEATKALRGEDSTMSLAAAIDLVHQTPADDRSAFAREIWQRRRARGTDRRR